jgi:hypothetical protein
MVDLLTMSHPRSSSNATILLLCGPQSLQRFFHKFAAYFFFLLRRDVGVADDMNDAVA